MTLVNYGPLLALNSALHPTRFAYSQPIFHNYPCVS